MKQAHKISSALFNSLGINISDPFIVMDHEGAIIYFNKSADDALSIEGNKNICDLFADQTITRLNDLIEEVFSGNKPFVDNLPLMRKSGAELNVRAIINSYKEDNDVFIFFTFIPQISKLAVGEITKFKIQTDELRKIIPNEAIFEIIEEIKSLYPFTFIGKEKLSRKVNELEELFWIKDIKGIFALVNNKLASNLGLKPFQIEGKPAQSFLPTYIIDFYNTIENYIKETLNSAVMQGIPIAGVNDPGNYKVIEIPLSDSENNVIAVIGIAQKIDQEAAGQAAEEQLLSPVNNILKSFPKALAFIDKSGVIKHGSEEFCKLFSDEFSDLRNFSYSKVFPLRLIEQIDQFLNSVQGFEKFELSLQYGLNRERAKNLIVSLSKIIGNENEFEGFSILLEEAAVEDNLERIINKRGRMFEILIQNNPEPIFIYDTENLRFIEANEAALALYGYRKDEFLQMDLTDLYTPEDIQTLLDSSNMAAKGGKFSGPYKHKKKDGAYIFVEISKIAFKYNEKDAHFNIIRDVTSRLELEKKSQLYRTAFDNTDDILLITDNVGIITFANSAVKKYLGYSKNEIENTSITALVKNDDRGTINSSIYHSHIVETITINTELKNSEGRFVEVELTAIPVLNYKDVADTFSIICKVNKNISEQQEVKEVIKEVFVEKPAVAGTGEMEQRDRDFLPGLFHEILTPINVILGFVQEFTADMKNLNPEQKEAVEIINQNRNMLLNIMNSVFEYSSSVKENEDLVIDEIGITDVIDRLQNDFSNITGGKKVDFAYGKISSSLKFQSDKEKFQNLVSTLLKISVLLNKETKIYFSAYQIDDNSFAVSLKDNYSFVSDYMLGNYNTLFGSSNSKSFRDLGISRMTVQLAVSLLKSLEGKYEVIEQDKGKIDCRFVFPLEIKRTEVIEPSAEQVKAPEVKLAEAPALEHKTAEPKKTKPKVKDIAEEHDEIIEEIEDEPVVENIPVEEEFEEPEEIEDIVVPVAKPKGKSKGAFSMAKLACLYIEDQVDSQILFKVQMKELKEIKFAVSFEEALPLLNNQHFDFLVIDINLQGEYNGLDALRIIHKMPGLENIPIIAVTAYVLPGDREKFIASGFNDFISKPIFHEKMVDVLGKIFAS